MAGEHPARKPGIVHAFRVIVHIYDRLQDHATARLIDCSADSIEPDDIADGIRSPFPSIDPMLTSHNRLAYRRRVYNSLPYQDIAT